MKEKDVSLGIIGSGRMGESLASYFIGFQFPIVWMCEFEEDVDKLRNLIVKKLRRSLRAGVIHEEDFNTRLEEITVSTNPEYLADCNLIIETINENLEQKQELFYRLDQTINSECIFTSNSSSITPDEWCPQGPRIERAVGLHFFFPVGYTNIVELIQTRKTSRQTVQEVMDFTELIQKRVILQQEESAFFLNKLFLDFQAGAYLLCRRALENSGDTCK